MVSLLPTEICVEEQKQVQHTKLNIEQNAYRYRTSVCRVAPEVAVGRCVTRADQYAASGRRKGKGKGIWIYIAV